MSTNKRKYGPRAPLLLFLTVLFCDCAGGYGVRTEVTDGGAVIDHMTGNEIRLEGEREYSDYAMEGCIIDLVGVEQHCFLDALRRREPDGTLAYYLRFSYSGPEPLAIERRRSLEIVIDKYTPHLLIGQGEITRNESKVNKTYSESFDYLVPEDILVRMANSDEVDVVVTGGEFVLRGYFVDTNFKNFKKFVRDYVGRDR